MGIACLLIYAVQRSGIGRRILWLIFYRIPPATYIGHRPKVRYGRRGEEILQLRDDLTAWETFKTYES